MRCCCCGCALHAVAALLDHVVGHAAAAAAVMLGCQRLLLSSVLLQRRLLAWRGEGGARGREGERESGGAGDSVLCWGEGGLGGGRGSLSVHVTSLRLLHSHPQRLAVLVQAIQKRLALLHHTSLLSDDPFLLLPQQLLHLSPVLPQLLKQPLVLLFRSSVPIHGLAHDHASSLSCSCSCCAHACSRSSSPRSPLGALRLPGARVWRRAHA
mmetsp:Transcript_14667/g.34773  ORF Transcript_14667/g.34773 Transcript_14667/m.34773 type:complete len:211 (-) Transcript_14667:823-1455(-)